MPRLPHARPKLRALPASSATIRVAPADAGYARSLLYRRCFQPDKRELEISTVPQRVHHLNQLTIAQRFVGGNEDRLVLVVVGGGIERARKGLTIHDGFADRNRLIRLDGDEDRLV